MNEPDSQGDLTAIRKLWLGARRDTSFSVSADDVLDRLECKYRVIADALDLPTTPASEVYLKLTMVDDVLIVPVKEL